MIDHSDRIRLFNWIKARATASKEASMNYRANSNPTISEFSEELQMQGKALALLEIGMAILDPEWHSMLSEYSDELAVPSEQ